MLRSILHRRGCRFRKDPLLRIGQTRIRPDLTFSRHKLAVFVDGCFWHQCPEHGRVPRANGDYWSTKLGRNVLRDRVVNELLRTAGWTVVRVWEHVAPEQAAGIVMAELAATGGVRGPEASPDHGSAPQV